MAKLNVSPIKGHLRIARRNHSGMGIGIVSLQNKQGPTVIVLILNCGMLDM